MAQPVVPTPYAIPPFFVYASLEGATRTGALSSKPLPQRYDLRRLLRSRVTGPTFLAKQAALGQEEIASFTRISRQSIYLCLVPHGKLRYPADHFHDGRSIVNMLWVEHQFRGTTNGRTVQTQGVG